VIQENVQKKIRKITAFRMWCHSFAHSNYLESKVHALVVRALLLSCRAAASLCNLRDLISAAEPKQLSYDVGRLTDHDCSIGLRAGSDEYTDVVS